MQQIAALFVQLNVPFSFTISPQRISFNAGLLAADDLVAIKNMAAASGFIYNDLATITAP